MKIGEESLEGDSRSSERSDPSEASRTRGTSSGDRLLDLSPEKRALLALRALKQKKQSAAVTAPSQSIRRRSNPSSAAQLSFSQQRLWFLNQLDPGSAAYSLPFSIRLRGLFSI